MVVGDKQSRDVAVLSAGGLLAEKYLVYMRAAAVCSKESPDTIAYALTDSVKMRLIPLNNITSCYTRGLFKWFQLDVFLPTIN